MPAARMGWGLENSPLPAVVMGISIVTAFPFDLALDVILVAESKPSLPVGWHTLSANRRRVRAAE